MHGAPGGDTAVLAHALTRLVVLPFRVLRADPETDFLAFSLPDAISTSLSGVGSLVLRSSAAAARFAGETPDLKALAAEADVDRVVMGTLLRAGRSAARDGATGGSAERHAADVTDHPVVDGRPVPAPGRHRPSHRRGAVAAADRRDAAADARCAARCPRLRALPSRQRAGSHVRWARRGARNLYLQMPRAGSRASRRRGPGSGRCYRVIGKYIDGSPDSESRPRRRFRRALALNPRLSIAHKFYANLEADIGHADRAIVRLLGEATRTATIRSSSPGSCTPCRYCGLFDQSLAAHVEARRLDPNVPTS